MIGLFLKKRHSNLNFRIDKRSSINFFPRFHGSELEPGQFEESNQNLIYVFFPCFENIKLFLGQQWSFVSSALHEIETKPVVVGIHFGHAEWPIY